MVICLERGANLHMAQLMPLPLTVSGFSKIQIGFYLSGTGSPRLSWKRGSYMVVCCYVLFNKHSITQKSELKKHLPRYLQIIYLFNRYFTTYYNIKLYKNVNHRSKKSPKIVKRETRILN